MPVLLTNIIQVIKSRRMKIGRACSTYGVEEKHIHSFGGEHVRKRPLGRPRHRWEDNVKIDFRKWDVGVLTGSNLLRTETGGRNF